MNVPLTKEQAQSLKCPTLMWLEESGGYEGSRYRANVVTVTETNDSVVCFHGPPENPWSGGRTWTGYNRSVCGFRFWKSEPSDIERLTAKWEVC